MSEKANGLGGGPHGPGASHLSLTLDVAELDEVPAAAAMVSSVGDVCPSERRQAETAASAGLCLPMGRG